MQLKKLIENLQVLASKYPEATVLLGVPTWDGDYNYYEVGEVGKGWQYEGEDSDKDAPVQIMAGAFNNGPEVE